jgi:hypothetical protein
MSPYNRLQVAGICAMVGAWLICRSVDPTLALGVLIGFVCAWVPLGFIYAFIK